MTSSNPKVATNSPSQRPPPVRSCVEMFTAESENIRFAIMHPTHAPAICATTYTTAVLVDVPPSMRSAIVTTGLKCAPETGPSARISATSPAPVAVEFSSSCKPVLPGDSRCAAIPEPTTIETRSAVPTASALAGRRSSRTRSSAATRRGLGRAVAAKRVLRFGRDCPELTGLHLDVAEDGVDLPRLAVGRVDPDLVLHRVATRDFFLGGTRETL